MYTLAVTEELLNRIAHTEYALYTDPAHTVAHRFGNWVRWPEFAWRHELNALHDVQCPAGEADALLQDIDQLYQGTGLPYRRMSYHRTSTLHELDDHLRHNGWAVSKPLTMVHRQPPKRALRSDLVFRSVPLHERLGDRAAVVRGDKWMVNGYFFRQAQDVRLGGEAIVAYLNGKPVGSTGYYIVNGVARFRAIVSHREHPRQGIATAMMYHVLSRPAVRAADAVVLFVGRNGPIHLYETMGFEPVHELHFTNAAWQPAAYEQHFVDLETGR